MNKRTFGQFKQVGAILIPSSIPEKVGLGCPKCDDHESVSFLLMGDDASQKKMEAFAAKHEACGELETLEWHGGELKLTGYLRAPE